MKIFRVICCGAFALWGCQPKGKATRIYVYATGESLTGGEVITWDGSVVFQPADGAIQLKYYRIESGESKLLSTTALSSSDNAIAWITPRLRDQNCEFANKTWKDGSGIGNILTTFKSPARVGHNLGYGCWNASDETLIFHYWVYRGNNTTYRFVSGPSLNDLVTDSKGGEVSFIAVTCAKMKQ
jgi:hypothetical protein